MGSKKERISFEAMFNQVTESIAEQIKKINAEIKIDFSECTYIDYPPLHLQSIMQNLLTNALKYRQPSKRLKIEITTKRSNGKVCLTIKDNGMGFDAHKYGKKVTGLFKRLHTHVEGKGIGLYIIKSIVNSHGGKIEIISEPNKGATFNIYL
jgi:signal transduction histidine kinase